MDGREAKGRTLLSKNFLRWQSISEHTFLNNGCSIRLTELVNMFCFWASRLSMCSGFNEKGCLVLNGTNFPSKPQSTVQNLLQRSDVDSHALINLSQSTLVTHSLSERKSVLRKSGTGNSAGANQGVLILKPTILWSELDREGRISIFDMLSGW